MIFGIFVLIFSILPQIFGTIVITSYGRIEGQRVEGTEYHSFKKIPFAKPPIGNLRFQKPEAPEKWDDLLNAKEYGPACLSNSSQTSSPQKWVSEDCLHLNIFTNQKCLDSGNCPIVFYIHGGSLMYDSAVMFNDTFFLNSFVRQDIVMVIPAFRLGIFSLFTINDQSLAPNNLAIYDILYSLEFVNREIQNFGGDPSRVTLLGHSFGGSIVSSLIFSQTVNNDLKLFQQVVSMSPGAIDFTPFEYAAEKTRQFSARAGCSVDRVPENQREKTMRDCLVGKDAFELLRVQRQLEEEGVKMGALVQRPPFYHGNHLSDFYSNPKKIPYLVGSTIHEFDDSLGDLPVPIILDYKNQKEIFEFYKNEKKAGKIDLKHTDETQQLMVSVRHRAAQVSKTGGPVFLYEYAYPNHSKHTDDLSFLMGIHRFEQDGNEKHLAEVYPTVFGNFIRFGTPKMGWEKYEEKKDSYFEINWDENRGIRPIMKDFYEKEIIEYWNQKIEKVDEKLTIFKNKACNSKINNCKEIAGRFATVNEAYHSLDDSRFNFMAFLFLTGVFLIGILLGKYSCNRERRLYIQLDGDDYSILENGVKA